MLSRVNLKLSSDFKRWGKGGKKETGRQKPRQKEKRVSLPLLEDHAKNYHYCLGFLASHLNYSQETLY